MGSCRSLPEEADLQGRAWWLFEEDGEWLGFSAEVSEALEAAYQHWQEEPEGGALQPVEQEPGKFLYDATVTKTWWDSGYEHGMNKAQAIRRIGVQGSAARLRSRRELESELQAAREAAEELRLQRDNEAEAHRRRVAELEKELEGLRGELAEQRDAWRRLSAGLSAPYPGRLVALTESCEAAPLGDAGTSLQGCAAAGALRPGSLGRVRSMEGRAVAVDFCAGPRAVWLPAESLELAEVAELLSRPGSRTLLPLAAGSRCRRGVVCDPLDGTTANVLGAEGRKRPCLLHELELGRCPSSSDGSLEVGDFVRCADASCELAAGGRRPGMVLARDGERLCVRFRTRGDEDSCVGCQDLWLSESQLCRDESADCIRPGVAVRFRDRDAEASLLPAAALSCAAPGRPPVGVVYAAHADGTAVVDFLGAFGCRCGAELLEVAERPSTADHAVLRVLGECLAWAEIAAEHSEEREEALMRRLARPRSGLAGAP